MYSSLTNLLDKPGSVSQGGGLAKNGILYLIIAFIVEFLLISDNMQSDEVIIPANIMMVVTRRI
jgi:hypothetical protein